LAVVVVAFPPAQVVAQIRQVLQEIMAVVQHSIQYQLQAAVAERFIPDPANLAAVVVAQVLILQDLKVAERLDKETAAAAATAELPAD
jgi:ppGpp synthetase/RelA/SpoT-type nucleotidyltranferase